MATLEMTWTIVQTTIHMNIHVCLYAKSRILTHRSHQSKCDLQCRCYTGSHSILGWVALRPSYPPPGWTESLSMLLNIGVKSKGQLKTKHTTCSSHSRFIAHYRAFLTFQKYPPTTIRYRNNSRYVEGCFD